MKACKIIETKANKKLIEFQVSVVKTITYRLWITEEAPKRVSWTLDSGDVFKTSTGSWDLSDAGGKTKARQLLYATSKTYRPSKSGLATLREILAGSSPRKN